MKKKNYFCVGLVLIGAFFLLSQINPLPVNSEFKNPIIVEIANYSGDAMEPFISSDGQILFFNSLNDGQNTSLLYAEKIDPTHFTFKGEVQGVNMVSPHLDAVASMDDAGNFYFISTRNYPTSYNTLYTGVFTNGVVSNVHQVEGNFYIEEAGWLIMDAEISRDGKDLYVVNARFTGGSMPTESKIRLCHLVDSQFILDSNSSEILQTVNSVDLNYAPCSSKNGLELFFTRANGLTLTTTICHVKRGATVEPYGSVDRLDLDGLVEAPTLTVLGDALYFHKKVDTTYQLFYMIRNA